MIRIKIRGGTVTHGDPPLCHTCRFATVVKGVSPSQEIVECSQLSEGRGRVPFPVSSCTGYADRRLPSLYHMEDIAWVLRSDANRRQVGFVRTRDLKPRERIWIDEE